MANVKLNRTVFDKRKFEQSVDTEFSQLVKPDQEPTPGPTVDEFFEMYTDLFYEIPKEGETNSHTFLIKESSEYVDFDKINDDIQVLLEEITSLREELLVRDQDNLDLQQKLAQAEANVVALQAATTQS